MELGSHVHLLTLLKSKWLQKNIPYFQFSPCSGQLALSGQFWKCCAQLLLQTKCNTDNKLIDLMVSFKLPTEDRCWKLFKYCQLTAGTIYCLEKCHMFYARHLMFFLFMLAATTKSRVETKMYASERHLSSSHGGQTMVYLVTCSWFLKLAMCYGIITSSSVCH